MALHADGADVVVSMVPRDPLAALAASPLLRKLAGGVSAPGYQVTFHTSNVIMAGTGAQVFFELVGEFGSTGERACMHARMGFTSMYISLVFFAGNILHALDACNPVCASAPVPQRQ